MADIRLTASQFCKMKQGELEFLSQKVIPSCEKMVSNTLLDEPFKFNPRFIDDAVRDIVHREKRIFDNAEQDCTDVAVKKSIASSLYEVVAICRKPLSEGFLLIRKAEFVKERCEDSESVDAVPFQSNSQESAACLAPHTSEILGGLYHGVALSRPDILRGELLVDDSQSSHVMNELKTFFSTRAKLSKRAALIMMDISDMENLEGMILDCFKSSRGYNVLPLVLDIVDYRSDHKEVSVTTYTTEGYSKATYVVTLSEELDSHRDLSEMEEVKTASASGFFDQFTLRQPEETAGCLFSLPSCDSGYDVVGNLEMEKPGFDYVDAV